MRCLFILGVIWMTAAVRAAEVEVMIPSGITVSITSNSHHDLFLLINEGGPDEWVFAGPETYVAVHSDGTGTAARADGTLWWENSWEDVKVRSAIGCFTGASVRVDVPEPPTVAGAMALIGLLGAMRRSRS